MTTTAHSAVRTHGDVSRWLVGYIADLFGCNPADIDTHAPFSRLGLDSSSAVAMTGDLERWLGFEVDPTLPYDFPTITTLAQALADQSAAHAAPGARQS